MQDIFMSIIGVILSANAYSMDVSQLNIDEIRCMADNIYFEGRNEGMAGQMAIALVTLNRVESDVYPNTICRVVKQGPTYKNNPDLPIRWRCQFTWYCDGLSDNIPLEYTKGKRKGQIRQSVYHTYSEIVKNAVLVMSGQITDFTEGATHYFAQNIVTPKWSTDKSMIRTTIIDNHTFMKAKEVQIAPGASKNP